MKLYDLLKDKLKDPKGVISDHEMCLLNRRDFMHTETSAAGVVLNMFNAKTVTYEMRAMIDFLFAFLCKLEPNNNIRVYQLSQSMTLPSLAIAAISASESESFKVYIPQGMQKVSCKDNFAADTMKRFLDSTENAVPFDRVGKGKNLVEIVLCNASNEADVASGIKLFSSVKRGVLLIKGYGRADAPNCGEIMLLANLNLHCTLAGFAFAAAI